MASIKTTTNIIINSEKLNTFPLRSGTRIYTLSTSLQHLASAIKEIKGAQTEKEKVKLFLCGQYDSQHRKSYGISKTTNQI